MSKGSGRRPKQISNQDYQDNWDRIFSKPQPKEKAVLPK